MTGQHGVEPVLDLRGDWAARPTPAMRRPMAEAEVGDDNTGEDPTVNRLEATVAERLGKEAALFVPSGTMGNLAAILALAPWGGEILAGDVSHVIRAEQGGAAVLGGRILRGLPVAPDGGFDPADVATALRPDDIHEPRTALLCLENTHNARGGVALSAARLRESAAPARAAGVPVHLDGSRLWHAAVALGVPEAELAAPADTVQVCLSKGLAAPVGSVLAGPRPVIGQARRHRKLLGGGMRQAGVLAAAGLVALAEMVDRLAEDHARARRLAEGLAALPGLTVDLATVQTNLVYATLAPGISADAFAAALAASGVRISAFGPRLVRFALHWEIDDAAVDRLLTAATAALELRANA